MTISGADTFTDWIKLYGPGILVIEGTVSNSTITLQFSKDGGTTAHDVDTYTSTYVDGISVPRHGGLFRAGVKSGDYGSDSPKVGIQS
ncbi:MAG: hypothetical protein KGY38_06430 [Desulfobacterales bacterium]|nr:hypothetical protein [Desulfobacterales bacterium]